MPAVTRGSILKRKVHARNKALKEAAHRDTLHELWRACRRALDDAHNGFFGAGRTPGDFASMVRSLAKVVECHADWKSYVDRFDLSDVAQTDMKAVSDHFGKVRRYVYARFHVLAKEKAADSVTLNAQELKDIVASYQSLQRLSSSIDSCSAEDAALLQSIGTTLDSYLFILGNGRLCPRSHTGEGFSCPGRQFKYLQSYIGLPIQRNVPPIVQGNGISRPQHFSARVQVDESSDPDDDVSRENPRVVGGRLSASYGSDDQLWHIRLLDNNSIGFHHNFERFADNKYVFHAKKEGGRWNFYSMGDLKHVKLASMEEMSCSYVPK